MIPFVDFRQYVGQPHVSRRHQAALLLLQEKKEISSTSGAPCSHLSVLIPEMIWNLTEGILFTTIVPTSFHRFSGLLKRSWFRTSSRGTYSSAHPKWPLEALQWCPLPGLQSPRHEATYGQELRQESQGRQSGGSSEAGSPHSCLCCLGPYDCLCAILKWESGEWGDAPCGNFCSVAGQEAPAEEMLWQCKQLPPLQAW